LVHSLRQTKAKLINRRTISTLAELIGAHLAANLIVGRYTALAVAFSIEVVSRELRNG
jgi:hypothetical protein